MSAEVSVLNRTSDLLKVIDADTLMSTPLPSIRYAVDSLLPQGLHILAGSPKIGKSWMVLWICLKIAMGDNVWDFPVTKGTVLYLCLEDSYQRIQQRLFVITETAPENLYFSNYANNIEDGLEGQIDEFINEHPDTCFIAIDTLQRVRKGTSDNNAYANDYKDLSRLKGIADRHRLAILLVHHLRKLNDADPFNMVSGTAGVIGAVDGNFVLQKEKRGSNTARLFVTGRDIEYRELTFELDGCIWKLINGDQNRIRDIEEVIDPIIDPICDFISQNGSWRGTATELIETLKYDDIPVNSLPKILNKNHEILFSKGIGYDYKRTASKKYILLFKINDGCDGNDGFFI